MKTQIHNRMYGDGGPFLPTWVEIAEQSSEPVTKTLDRLYVHGGGWNPFKGFMLGTNNSLKYPGDPSMQPLITWTLEKDHEGTIVCLYESEWVAVILLDRTFEVCRMD